MQAYAAVLQAEPDNVKAIAGLARCYLAGGDAERAREVADMAPGDAKDPDLASVRAALQLAGSAAAASSDEGQAVRGSRVPRTRKTMRRASNSPSCSPPKDFSNPPPSTC